MSDILKHEAGVSTTAGERRDNRPPSLRYQDAAILEYAVRNRLLRGSGTPADLGGDGHGMEAPRSPRTGRRPRRTALRAAARAEGIYRRIAPPGQTYPLQAVALVRRLLHEGAPDEFVEGKYKTHTRCCDEFGVPPLPLIPYLAELLEVFLLDRKAARRDEALREHSVP